MLRSCLSCRHPVALGIMSGVVVVGMLGLPSISAMTHNAVVEVRDNATNFPEVGAFCSLLFLPSGMIVNATTDSIGVATASAPPADNFASVICIAQDETVGISNSTLKAQGDTVVPVRTD